MALEKLQERYQQLDWAGRDPDIEHCKSATRSEKGCSSERHWVGPALSGDGPTSPPHEWLAWYQGDGNVENGERAQ